MKVRDEVAVGSLFLFTLVLGVLGALWVRNGGLSPGYDMYSRFPWGAGLKIGQPVLLAGVNVGAVSGIELDPAGTIVVTMNIKNDYKIPINSTATVEANGIFGDQLIAIKPVRATTQYMPEKDTIPTGVSAPGISDLVAKGDSIARNVNMLTGDLRAEFVDSGGLRDIRAAVREMSVLMKDISQVVKVQSDELTKTQKQAQRLLAIVDSAKIDSTLVNVRAASANLERMSRGIDSTRLQVNALLNKVNNGNGTLSLLLNDRVMYDRLNALSLRLDSLMIEFQKNPRKFINLKIF